MKNYKLIRKVMIIVIAIAVFVTALAIILKLNENKHIDSDLPQSLTDEISRAKLFVLDWFNELSNDKKCNVFLNELNIENGKYTLTFAKNRIRATYPKGERFFKCEEIKKVEFLIIDGVIRGRFSYGKNGEYMFRIGKG